MRILVIDDKPEQLEHAENALSQHTVATANGWNVGKELIERGGWDVVLTDLSMPAVEDGQSNALNVGQPTPYGFPLALLALKAGVEKVAIVSNGNESGTNHHEHPIYWAADALNGQIIPGRFWAFTGYNCPNMSDHSSSDMTLWQLKNWSAVLDTITS